MIKKIWTWKKIILIIILLMIIIVLLKWVYEKKSVNLIAFYGNIKLIIGGDFLWAERKENH